MKNLENKNKIVIFLGITLIVSGLLVLTSNYFNEKIDNAYSYMNNLLLTANTEEVYEIQEEVDTLSDSTSSFQEEPAETEEVKEEKKEYVDPYLQYYIASIQIPKINLNKGFTDVNSPYNTVNKNIEVIKGSTYPDQEKGNLILASHSGNSYLAYFKNLYKLVNGDVAYITYQDKKYTYKIVNIYEQPKIGKIAIYRDHEKTCLTLITCTKNKKDTQTVYILELQSVEAL